MNVALEMLVEAIKSDYRNWMLRDDEYTNTQKKMIADFEAGLGFTEGKKYIKITKDNNGSVWGFVVKADGPKFKAGDILKAAGWNAPATNAARGNVFDGYEIRWTGPNYLV